MIVPLREADDAARFGGKAAQLARSLVAGFPVPDGFALSVEAAEAVAAGDAELVDEVRGMVAALGGCVAARSSGVGEDAHDASFAGQHLTVLGVTSDDGLVDAIGRVVASATAEAARAYRARLGLPEEAHIGVVVQRLVEPDVAGVVFTTNPVNGADEVVVSAAWGLGEAVVAGLVTPDHIRLAPDGALLEYAPGHKDLMLVRGAGGTEEREVSGDRVEARCLDDAQLTAVHELAARCAEALGAPADVEFAFAGGRLFLLQSRPVTRAGDA